MMNSDNSLYCAIRSVFEHYKILMISFSVLLLLTLTWNSVFVSTRSTVSETGAYNHAHKPVASGQGAPEHLDPATDANHSLDPATDTYEHLDPATDTYEHLDPAMILHEVGDIPFQGNLTLSRYAVNADGTWERISQTPMLVHEDYILLVPSHGQSVEVFGNILAEGLLIRQKQEDFVFLTSDAKAIIMNKQELQQMVVMLESLRGRGNNGTVPDPEITLLETNDKKKVEGYDVRKWIAQPAESNQEWHIWLTDDLVIPWGLLSERWLTRQTFLSGLPAEQWLIDEKLPLQIDILVNSQLTEMIKIEKITDQQISASRFQIPEGYQRTTFQQILFERMRNRQAP